MNLKLLEYFNLFIPYNLLHPPLSPKKPLWKIGIWDKTAAVDRKENLKLDHSCTDLIIFRGMSQPSLKGVQDHNYQKRQFNL